MLPVLTKIIELKWLSIQESNKCVPKHIFYKTNETNGIEVLQNVFLARELQHQMQLLSSEYANNKHNSPSS